MARRLIVTGDALLGRELGACGFLAEVVDGGHALDAAVARLVEHLRQLSPLARRLTREQLQSAPLATGEERRADIERFVRALGDPDFVRHAARHIERLSARRTR